MQNIVFFDIDGTLIKGQSQFLLVKYLFKKRKVSIFFLIDVFIWFILYRVGLIKNPASIMRRSYRLVKDWPINDVSRLMNEFYDCVLKNNLKQIAVERLREHQKNNDHIIILSNVMMPLAKVIAGKLGVNNVIATKLDVRDGHYSGKIDGEVVYAKNKAIQAEKYIQKNNFSFDNSYSYADHISDVAIMNLVKNPVAISPGQKFLERARINNWEIIN